MSGGNNQKQGGKAAPGITVNHGISSVKPNGTPMQKAVQIGIDLLIGTFAAFAAAWAGEKANDYFENRQKSAPKPAPADTSRQQFEHMVGMSIRDCKAKGRGDVNKVKKMYLEHNPQHAQWRSLEDEIRGILKLVEKDQWIAPDPDPMFS